MPSITADQRSTNALTVRANQSSPFTRHWRGSRTESIVPPSGFFNPSPLRLSCPASQGPQPSMAHQPFLIPHCPNTHYPYIIPLASTPINPSKGRFTSGSSKFPQTNRFFLRNTVPTSVDSSYSHHQNFLSQSLQQLNFAPLAMTAHKKHYCHCSP